VTESVITAAVDDLVSRITTDGRIVQMSASTREILGLPPEQVVGRNIGELMHPGDRARLPTDDDLRLAPVTGDRFTLRLRHRQGHWVWLETVVACVRAASGPEIEISLTGRDVTGEKSYDPHGDQESKLESLGRLSAGLAHEINSPIQFVGDNSRFLAAAYGDLLRIVLFYRGLLDSDAPIGWEERLARMQVAEEGIEFEYLQKEIPSAVAQTLEGIERVSTIVRAMKTFSHPGNKEQVPADLNEALEATITVTRHQVNSVADLDVDLAQLPPVRCNIADLNQVFLNLIVNAADAISETGVPGVIQVRTRVDGDHVLVSIADTGTGIPENVRKRMFDPFFTTKEIGRGSGQGLPLVRAVVHEGHGGVLTVESTIGSGSTFTVRLPIDGKAERV
jgi:PAS domain S-box-containing protein